MNSKMLNLLKGDIQRSLLNVPSLGIKTIQPLKSIHKQEINLAFNLVFQEKIPLSCPHSSHNRRNDIAEFLSNEEIKRPGTIKTMVHSIDNMKNEDIIFPLFESKEHITCEICNNLTYRSPCTSCNLLKLITK